MKIKIAKASGAEVDLSDVVSIQINDAPLLSIRRVDPFSSDERFSLDVRGDNLAIRDERFVPPRNDTVIG